MRVFNLPKPHVPSQYVYLHLCVSVGTTERYFTYVKCDVSMHLKLMMKLFSRTLYGVTPALVYNRTLTLLFCSKLPWLYEGPVYVSVWFNQVVLKDCVILSYVSELCSIMFFASPSTALNGLLYTRCIIIMCWSKKHFLKDNHAEVNQFTPINKML